MTTITRILRHVEGIAHQPGISLVHGYATTAPDAASLRQAFSHCVNLVRMHDYENYLWCIQLPKALRAPILALRAFNVETIQIADQARTEMLVMMRCQWWRDALNAAYKGSPPEQPAVTALSGVLRHHTLTRYRLQRMLSTREEDMLRTQQLPTLAAVEAFAEGTASQLLYLQLEAAGAAGAGADHAASHLGKAAGMVALLRGTARHAQRQRTYLPADLCERHGVNVEEVLGGRSVPSTLPDVVLDMASAAKAHLEEARGRMGDVPPAARALMLPAVGTGLYLSALERYNFDVFHPKLQLNGGVSPLRYQLQLKWHMLRGTY